MQTQLSGIVLVMGPGVVAAVPVVTTGVAPVVPVTARTQVTPIPQASFEGISAKAILPEKAKFEGVTASSQMPAKVSFEGFTGSAMLPPAAKASFEGVKASSILTPVSFEETVSNADIKVMFPNNSPVVTTSVLGIPLGGEKELAGKRVKVKDVEEK